MKNFDWTSLSDYEGILSGETPKVTEFFRSMPSGPDMESFQTKSDEGKLIVSYGDQATEVDPAVLQKTMEDVAAQAKQHVQYLETVKFRVGNPDLYVLTR